MKKIILIITVVVALVVVAGCAVESTAVEEDVQENISQEEIAAKDEGCEEADEEHEHDHSVEIEGSEMKALSVREVADLWEINSEVLLSKIIAEFDLQKEYTISTTLEEIRQAEYKFSPAIIKDIAEEIKGQA